MAEVSHCDDNLSLNHDFNFGVMDLLEIKNISTSGTATRQLREEK